MKKNQTKKKPVNVQMLSADDLAEVLNKLKRFMAEEISGHSRRTSHLLDCHNSRIVKLERIQQYQEVKRVPLCPHEYRFKSIWYSAINSQVMGLKYKCRRCDQEYIKTMILLSWREKRALRKLGVKI